LHELSPSHRYHSLQFHLLKNICHLIKSRMARLLMKLSSLLRTDLMSRKSIPLSLQTFHVVFNASEEQHQSWNPLRIFRMIESNRIFWTIVSRHHAILTKNHLFVRSSRNHTPIIEWYHPIRLQSTHAASVLRIFTIQVHGDISKSASPMISLGHRKKSYGTI
jgi:hypothetical protein